MKFSRHCAHQRRNSSALTRVECSLSAHCLETDEGISRKGGNYLHFQKQGVGRVAQGDRKVWERFFLLPLAQEMEREKSESDREEAKASGEPAALPEPNSEFVLVEHCCLSFSPRPVASGLSSRANIFLCITGKIGPTD